MTWLDEPTVHAARYAVEPPDGGSEGVAPALTLLLNDIARALEEAGCRLIGHLKALAEGVPGGGHFYASLTSLEQGVSLRGELASPVREIRLTLNLIVYGLEKGRLAEIADGCVTARFGGGTRA